MRDNRFVRFFRQCSLVLIPALAATTALAQDEAVRPDYESGPAARPGARADGLEFYQVHAQTDYLPGRLRVANSVTGEILPVRKTGLLIIQNGKIVGRAESGVGGVAQIPTLPAGVYAVVAIGPDGMGTFALEIVPRLEAGLNTPTYIFDALIVPAPDVVAAQRVLVGNAPAQAIVPAPPAPAPAPLAPIPAAQKQDAETVIKSAPVYVADNDGVDTAAAPCKGEIVTVGPRERLVAQLVVLDSRTGQTYPFANGRVAFARGGRVLGTVETNSEGFYAATGLENGAYSMVALGPNGVIAVGVQVQTVAAATTAQNGLPTATTFVTLLQDDIPTVDLQASAADAGAIPFVPGMRGPDQPFPPGFGPPPPVPGAGFGGGGGGFGAGGGGGFGGGGLWGALLGAGLGAGIGAAVASDNDDDPSVIVVSPANPPQP